jgi:hypothetical protein
MANERLYTKQDLAAAFQAQTGRTIKPLCIRDLAFTDGCRLPLGDVTAPCCFRMSACAP